MKNLINYQTIVLSMPSGGPWYPSDCQRKVSYKVTLEKSSFSRFQYKSYDIILDGHDVPVGKLTGRRYLWILFLSFFLSSFQCMSLPFGAFFFQEGKIIQRNFCFICPPGGEQLFIFWSPPMQWDCNWPSPQRAINHQSIMATKAWRLYSLFAVKTFERSRIYCSFSLFRRLPWGST